MTASGGASIYYETTVGAGLPVLRTVADLYRLVLDDLATIIGEVHSDDVLGEIFSRFCIGK